MKKLFVVAAIAFAGFSTLESKASVVSQELTISVQDSVTKTPIKVEELPEAVKTVLQSDTHKDWTPSAAFAVKDGDKEYFQIDMKKGEEEATLKLDKEGKPVEG